MGSELLNVQVNQAEICAAIGLPIIGDMLVDFIAPLDAALDHCLYFINRTLSAEEYEVFHARIGCIILAPFGSTLADQLRNCTVFEVAAPRAAMGRVLEFIRDHHRLKPLVDERLIAATAKISPLSVIVGDVDIGAHTIIEPFCSVGPDVRIGQRSVIRTGARIESRVSIGDDVVIGPNAVVGSAGFGFVRDASGNKIRLPHLGGVSVGSHVEIGALSCVQTGTIAPTVLEEHVKIADSVFVGHNARIQQGSSLVPGVVIGGSAVVGADSWVGMNATIRNGHRIGPRSLVGMDASVQQSMGERGVARAPSASATTRTDDDPTSIGFA